MRLDRTYRIISLVLAIIMFTTSTGFSVDFHFCNGDLKSFSITGEAQSCHTAKKKCQHHTTIDTDTEKKKCCSNEKFELENLDKDFVPSVTTEFNDVDSEIAPFEYSVSNVNQSFFSPKIILPENTSPLPPWDIYVLLERFLL